MKIGLQVLIVWVLCGLAGGLEAAERQDPGSMPGAAAMEEGDQLPSVILDLHKAKSEFDKYFSEKLEPQMERMGQLFAANVSRAEELLAKRQKDPENTRLRAEYEDCISEGIRQGMTWLGNFGQLKEPTFKALDGVGKSIGTAKQTMESNLAQSHKQFETNQDRAQAIRQRLKELAQQYKQHIQEGKQLSPEVEQDIRMAQTDRETAEAMARIDQLQESQTREAMADLEAQQSELLRVRNDLQIAFRQADNHRRLLVKVATLKWTVLQAQAVRQRLEAVQQVVSKRETDLSNLNKLVKRIVDKDFAVGNSGAKRPATTAQTQAGIEILRGYLDEAPANKEKSDVAKK
jgi:hypothetical protein